MIFASITEHGYKVQEKDRTVDVPGSSSVELELMNSLSTNFDSKPSAANFLGSTFRIWTLDCECTAVTERLGHGADTRDEGGVPSPSRLDNSVHRVKVRQSYWQSYFSQINSSKWLVPCVFMGV